MFNKKGFFDSQINEKSNQEVSTPTYWFLSPHRKIVIDPFISKPFVSIFDDRTKGISLNVQEYNEFKVNCENIDHALKTKTHGVWTLSDKYKASVSFFRDQSFIHIRDERKKGVAFSLNQYNTIKNLLPEIDNTLDNLHIGSPLTNKEKVLQAAIQSIKDGENKKIFLIGGDYTSERVENIPKKNTIDKLNDEDIEYLVDEILNLQQQQRSDFCIDTLDLSFNMITSKGASKIAELIEHVTIKNLFIAYNYIGNIGLQSIYWKLVNTETTLCLDVSFNGINSTGFQTIFFQQSRNVHYLIPSFIYDKTCVLGNHLSEFKHPFEINTDGYISNEMNEIDKATIIDLYEYDSCN